MFKSILIRQNFLLAIFILFFLNAFSQSKTEFIYYDWDGNETSFNSNNYGHYRRIEKNTNNQIITISDFYKGGQLNQILYIENVQYPRLKEIMEMKITGIQVIYHGDLTVSERNIFKNGVEIDSKTINDLQKKNSVNSDNHEQELSRINTAKDNTWSIIGIAASAYGFYKLITYSSNNSSNSTSKSNSSSQTSSNSSQKQEQSDYAPREMNNVDIVDVVTFGSLAYEHAQIQIRNKNNYDVIVSIELKQGESWYSSIVAPDKTTWTGYDYSERFNSYFKVKANSIRTVGLKTDETGRPNNVRIKSVR